MRWVFNKMADIFDPELEPSTLLCDETKDFCFDDDDDDLVDASGGPPDDDHHQYKNGPGPGTGSESMMMMMMIQLPTLSEDDFGFMVEREKDYLPKLDYLTRLRCGELNLGARTMAFDWICKAHSYYSFGPLSLCLAVNYFDRFLSIRELPRDKAWAVQLLAVACLSIAAKIEETIVPQSVELQVGDPQFVFEAKTIQRMELLVLDTLNWRMNAVTPCSFLDYSLKKLTDAHQNNNFVSSSIITTSTKVMNKSMQMILSTFRGIDFLEFKPSEIAAAVAIILVSAEIQAVDIDKSISCFIHLEKARVLKCIEMMKGMSMSNGRSENGGNGRSSLSLGQVVPPQSPIGVLDSACFSYKSDELTTTVGLCAYKTTTTTTTTTTTITTTNASGSCSPETKRMKLDTTTTSTFGLDS